MEESCSAWRFATALSGTALGRNRQHPDGRRARHRIRQDAGARVQDRRPASTSISRSSTTPRCTPSWCRSWWRPRAATRPSSSTSTGSASSPRPAGCSRSMTASRPTSIDTSVYVPKLMDLVGKVDGVTYMLPFYNYAMGLLYRKDLLADEKNKADFQGEVRHGPRRAEDLGRISEAGRVLHQGRHARRRQPGPAARSDRHGMVELPVRQRRRVSRCRAGSRRSIPKPA